MKPREVYLGVIDGRQEGEKLELVARTGECGTVELELRLLTWGEGIGWYRQRTLPLPPDLGGLLILLRRAERQTRHAGSGQTAGAQIVQFPRPPLLAAG